MALALLASVEAAERIGIDRSTLSRWVKDGRITPVYRLPGKRGAMLFDAADVDALAAEWAGEQRHGRSAA